MTDHALELKAWRRLGQQLAPLMTRVLAAQGELPEPGHIRLQHDLADLNRGVIPLSTQTQLNTP